MKNEFGDREIIRNDIWHWFSVKTKTTKLSHYNNAALVRT